VAVYGGWQPPYRSTSPPRVPKPHLPSPFHEFLGSSGRGVARSQEKQRGGFTFSSRRFSPAAIGEYLSIGQAAGILK